jgi:hypothetical protein
MGGLFIEVDVTLEGEELVVRRQIILRQLSA